MDMVEKEQLHVMQIFDYHKKYKMWSYLPEKLNTQGNYYESLDQFHGTCSVLIYIYIKYDNICNSYTSTQY